MAAGIGQAAHDGEGRVLTAEFEAFFLVGCSRGRAALLGAAQAHALPWHVPSSSSAPCLLLPSTPPFMDSPLYPHPCTRTHPCTQVSVYVPNSGEGLKRLDYRVGEWDRGARRGWRGGLCGRRLWSR